MVGVKQAIISYLIWKRTSKDIFWVYPGPSPTDRDREFTDLAYLVWEMDVAVPVTPETVLHARVRLRDCIRHCGRRTGNVPLRYQHFKRSFFLLPQITYHSANSRIKLLSLRCVVNFICLLLLPVHRIHFTGRRVFSFQALRRIE